MRKTNIVVPVKNPALAKQRLSSVLSQVQRQDLAFALFRATLGLLLSLPSRPNVLVVTDDPRLLRVAESMGAEGLLEEKAESETKAVERATAWSVEKKFERQIVVPGDMAHLDTREMESLLAMDLGDRYTVLCPAVGEDGTNAILTSPPDVLPYRFGARSFPDYIERAKSLGLKCEILRLPSLVLDVDTPEDLLSFLVMKEISPAHALLEGWGITVAAVTERMREGGRG